MFNGELYSYTGETLRHMFSYGSQVSALMNLKPNYREQG